jgi:preprotein translocase subunit YajC
MRRYVDVVVLLVAVLFTPSFVLAQAGIGGMSLGGLMPLLFIFAFFYLFLIRPQQKKAKERQKLLNFLKKDDRVITAGGVYATISSVKGNVVEVKISDTTYVKIAKQSIASVITKETDEEVTSKIPEVIKK